MDDDLVLNLAADDVVGPRKSGGGSKGGRWTDRLKAKRVTKRKAPVPQDIEEVRPEKRPRTEVSQKPTPAASSGGSRPSNAAPKQTQIISSLFTSNPKIQAPKNVASTSQKPSVKPSNAPVDFSTFEGLGLDPLLVSHLTNKMGIKRPTGIQRAALPLMLSTPTASGSRDVFLQSQTGSGKTLAFLLPIIQDLLPLSSLSYIDRSIGTLAIIIAPTRELAKQISDVVEALIKMRLRTDADTTGDSEHSTRMTRWLVSGLLIGGATRTHEKARLRKGVPILVSTPGRLLDHIQNTSSFNVGKCRWLVLDEADQLMELGFEETITGILKGLEGRRRLAMQAVQEGTSDEVGGWDWEKRRRTVLCSATIRESVQKLAGTALVNPFMIKATELDGGALDVRVAVSGETSTSLTPPSQLTQKYVIAPLKLRLVALMALLRTLISQGTGGTKIIVFLSCTDSVDFHWNLLGGAHMGTEGPEEKDDESESEEEDSDEDSNASDIEQEKKRKRRPVKNNEDEVEAKCSLLPDVSVFRLHGSLPTATRQRALKGFAGGKATAKKGVIAPVSPSSSSSIMLCTSVAARGLDLPLVRAVIQYDLPTEGGPTEYVHRIGRTARAGKGGEAWSIVAPSESEWAKWVVDKMEGDEEGGTAEGTSNNKKITLTSVPFETVLQNGYGGKGKDYEARATDVQLAFERWVLKNSSNAGIARKAYLSHMRAYATHPSNEKHMFHIRHLHLGHLAKSFALREAPTKVNAARQVKSRPVPKWDTKNKAAKAAKGASSKSKSKGRFNDDSDSGGDDLDAEKRMKAVVRVQGRLSRKGGAMMRTDTSEFQIMDADYLEKMVQGRG